MRLGIALAIVALAAASVGFAAWDGPPESETVIAAGNIASCAGTGDERTAALVAKEPGTVLPLGDLTYPRGSAAELRRCYGHSWGRFRARSRPVPGDNEYATGDGAPYRDYFDLARTYYAFDLGAWRLYALDSESVTPVQLNWLRRDLAANPRRCVLAYWHRPLFSSGYNGDTPSVRPFWRLLVAARAEVVLNANDHDYERFTRLDASGGSNWSGGIREFVVGTGGRWLRPAGGVTWRTKAIQWWRNGVLRLQLGEHGYSWTYLTPDGRFEDFGGDECR
jgi:hypothetical protein